MVRNMIAFSMYLYNNRISLGLKQLWLVFFAPSSTSSVLALSLVLDILRNPRVRIAAIGPTTSKYLREERGLTVHAEAQHPNTEALKRCIEAYDASHSL